MTARVLKCILPSMLAFAFSGLYAIVDGFFIGQSIGDVGLAAVNIAYPLTVVMLAAGTGLGMGGAVQTSFAIGRGDDADRRRYLTNSVILLAGVGALLGLILAAVCPSALALLGAEGETLEAAVSYTRIIALGALFQCFSAGLAPIVRNYDGALAAMAAMICGFISNIVLDYLFVMVFRWGTPGAAWATILGQGVTVLPCAVVLTRRAGPLTRADWKLSAAHVREIVKIGLSPFGLTLSPNLAIVLLNKGAAIWGGPVAIAAYAVVSYVTCVAQLLFQGIGDGSQPLMSLSIGLGRPGEAKKVRTVAYVCAEITAFITLLALYLLRGAVPGFFGVSAAAAPLVEHSLLFFLMGFPFAAFCRITTSYFYATGQDRFAYLMIYGEPVLLWALIFGGLPGRMGLDGVWMAVPAAQTALTLAGLGMLIFERRKKQENT